MKTTRMLHRLGLAALVFGLVGASPPARAASTEVEGVRQAIKARGAQWHADDTSMTKLSHEERKKRLGLNDDGEDATAAPSGDQAPIPGVTAAPPTLDWRNTGGFSYVSPIKNQGSCGSCWAFAVTAGLESQYMLAHSAVPVDLSEQILVSCSGAGSCSGGYPSTASTYIQTVGLPLESCFPYTGTNNLCTNACANWQSDTDQINGWHSAKIATTLVDAIKDALYAYGPVVVTFDVYNDFYSYRSGVYSYASGAYVGGHAVLAVGYDDVQRAFIVKNSWGTGWGEAGYFQISYDETTGTSRFGRSVLVYDGYKGTPPPPDTNPPVVSISAPTEGATLTGTASVVVNASDDIGVSSVKLSVDGALLGSVSTSRATFTWNTLTATNGGHTLQAVAADAAGNTTSAQVNVAVYNAPDTTAPTVAITAPSSGSTLARTTKIKASASDSGRVRRLDAYGDDKLLGSVTCSATACSGTFNWNTSSLAKGPHTITVNAYDAASNKGTASMTVNK